MAERWAVSRKLAKIAISHVALWRRKALQR
jgi:hypothetical protein